MTELTQRSTRLHEQALVTAGKQMPSLVAKPVEAAGESRLQPLHAGDEISEGCFQREMEMIAHDHERVQEPRTALTRLEQRRLKGRPCFLVAKNPGAIISPVDDVVNRAREFESQLAGHAETSAAASGRRQRPLTQKIGYVAALKYPDTQPDPFRAAPRESLSGFLA